MTSKEITSEQWRDWYQEWTPPRMEPAGGYWFSYRIQGSLDDYLAALKAYGHGYADLTLEQFLVKLGLLADPNQAPST